MTMLVVVSTACLTRRLAAGRSSIIVKYFHAFKYLDCHHLTPAVCSDDRGGSRHMMTEHLCLTSAGCGNNGDSLENLLSWFNNDRFVTFITSISVHLYIFM